MYGFEIQIHTGGNKMRRSSLVFLIASALLFGQNAERPGTTTAVIQNQPALALADIEKMLAAQVPEDVIALRVKQVRKGFTLSAEEIIALKKPGVSVGIWIYRPPWCLSPRE
jgi:hypothetical protein